MIEQLREIFETLKKNRLRTILTGFSISWGIFILVVLLGAGNGLKNAVTENMQSRAVNQIRLHSGYTSETYKGLKKGRRIAFTEQEVEVLKQLRESDLITPQVQATKNISYGKEYGSYTVMGTTEAYGKIEKLKIEAGNGRFINNQDVKNKTKVIVLDKKVATALFKDENPIGKYVKVGDVMLRVIGINTKALDWSGAKTYIPFTTAQIILNPHKKFEKISFTVKGLETEAQNSAFNKLLRNKLGRILNFDPKDDQAIWINNTNKEYLETKKIFSAITIFVTIIGVLTLIAGIVGVSNIMLVSVKERTREIGIRKALGAPPRSILKSINLESLIITSIFGYIGMMVGMGLTEIISFAIDQSAKAGGDEMQMAVFKDPVIGLNYAIMATLILIVAGIIAGYLPAKKAVKIKPIEAMRQE